MAPASRRNWRAAFRCLRHHQAAGDGHGAEDLSAARSSAANTEDCRRTGRARRGTTFRILLPAARWRGKGKGRHDRAGVMIHIVDDDEGDPATP